MKIIKQVVLLIFLSLCLPNPIMLAEEEVPQSLPPLIPWKPNFSCLPKSCRVEKISESPYILCIHDFMTDEEVEHFKEISKPRLKRSIVVENEKSGEHPHRTSSSAFLHDANSDMVTGVRTRAAQFLNREINNIEHLQVVHYRDSQKYDPHFDFFDRSLASAKDVIGNQGQRIATLLVYLNDVEDGAGGETIFPRVQDGLKIKPKKNMAVFWFNVLESGKEDERTLHGGMPIHSGEKWATNIWIRDPKVIDRPE